MSKNAEDRVAQIREQLNKASALRRKLGLSDEQGPNYASIRMGEGLKKVLELHAPCELSSICGNLGLKVLQKGSKSIEQILSYAADERKVYKEDKIKKILSIMWEGPLWEYLRCIGHPVSSSASNPRDTIMEVWKKGGLLGLTTSAFTPHFLVREVKPRYLWIQSEDINSCMTKLNVLQENVKRAERLVMTDSDFTNVQCYFRDIAELRKYENEVREFLASELEICRAKVDSQDEVFRISLDHVAECEQQFVSVAGGLNERLAHTEYLLETSLRENFRIESDIQRLQSIVDSYVEVAIERERVGGGTFQAQSLHNPAGCNMSVRVLHEKLQAYKLLRDRQDDNQRENARRLIQETDAAMQDKRWAATNLEIALSDTSVERCKARAATQEVRYCAEKMVQMSLRQQSGAHEAWASSLRGAAKILDYEKKINATVPVLTAGIMHSDKTLKSVCDTLIDALGLNTREDIKILRENLAMELEDMISTAYRAKIKADEEMEREAAELRLKSKTKLQRAGSRPARPGSGSGKKGGGDSRATTPAATSRARTGAGSPSKGAASKPGTATGKGRSGTPTGAAAKKDNNSNNKNNVGSRSSTPAKGRAGSPAAKLVQGVGKSSSAIVDATGSANANVIDGSAQAKKAGGAAKAAAAVTVAKAANRASASPSPSRKK
jgi:hypothetical protein